MRTLLVSVVLLVFLCGFIAARSPASPITQRDIVGPDGQMQRVITDERSGTSVVLDNMNDVHSPRKNKRKAALAKAARARTRAAAKAQATKAQQAAAQRVTQAAAQVARKPVKKRTPKATHVKAREPEAQTRPTPILPRFADSKVPPAAAPTEAAETEGQLISAHFRPREGKVLADHTNIHHNKEFTYMFWLRPTERALSSKHFTNILHKGDVDNQRNPAFFMFPTTDANATNTQQFTRLRFKSGTENSWDDGVDVDTPLPIMEWVHVCATHGGKGVSVFLNGKLAAHKGTSHALPNRGNLFGSDIFYPAAPADVSDLRIFNYAVSKDLCKQHFERRNHRAGAPNT